MAVTKILLLCCLALPLIAAAGHDGSINYLDVETPNFFNYNSPLTRPESLRSRPYYDFLSTLYAHDKTKTDLFRPYTARTRREASVEPAPVPSSAAAVNSADDMRSKRAIVFRPLFVYKQQQIKKQQYPAQRRRV